MKGKLLGHLVIETDIGSGLSSNPDNNFFQIILGIFIREPITFEDVTTIGIVLGILAAKKAKQGQKKLTVAYMITAVVAPVCALLIRPDFVVAFVCGIGLIMLVPPILNMIAGGKLLQAASINE